MEMEFIRELQAYGYIAGIMFCTFMLYGYIYHIYKNEKKGINNYEKYANIALDDELDSTPIETTSSWDKKNK